MAGLAPAQLEELVEAVFGAAVGGEERLVGAALMAGELYLGAGDTRQSYARQGDDEER